MRILSSLILLLAVSGCANVQLCNIHPDWNPPQGYDWAVAQCESKKSSVYSMNPYDEAFKKKEAFNACMASYGYEMRRIIKAAPGVEAINKEQVLTGSIK